MIWEISPSANSTMETETDYQTSTIETTMDTDYQPSTIETTIETHYQPSFYSHITTMASDDQTSTSINGMDESFDIDVTINVNSLPQPIVERYKIIK